MTNQNNLTDLIDIDMMYDQDRNTVARALYDFIRDVDYTRTYRQAGLTDQILIDYVRQWDDCWEVDGYKNNPINVLHDAILYMNHR